MKSLQVGQSVEAVYMPIGVVSAPRTVSQIYERFEKANAKSTYCQMWVALAQPDSWDKRYSLITDLTTAEFYYIAQPKCFSE